jgi:hypothetical protein
MNITYIIFVGKPEGTTCETREQMEHIKKLVQDVTGSNGGLV